MSFERLWILRNPPCKTVPNISNNNLKNKLKESTIIVSKYINHRDQSIVWYPKIAFLPFNLFEITRKFGASRRAAAFTKTSCEQGAKEAPIVRYQFNTPIPCQLLLTETKPGSLIDSRPDLWDLCVLKLGKFPNRATFVFYCVILLCLVCAYFMCWCDNVILC